MRTLSQLRDLFIQGKRVDIQTEYGQPQDDNMISVHQYLEMSLKADFVFYDHGTGEVADFITFSKTENAFVVKLYHVKAAGGSSAGGRVSDVYEGCGQAVKSVMWCRKETLLGKIQNRMRENRATRSHFITPSVTLENLVRLWEETNRIPLPTHFEIVIVQPGIEASALPEKIANVLASTRDYIVRSGGMQQFQVIASA